MWRTNDAELHGRAGQPQSGVDVYGSDRVEGRFTGVQCKGKDGDYGRPLTIAELLTEVEKAKSFRPPLQTFVLATSAPNDVELQAEARGLTDDHRGSGLFEVRVQGWGTLKQRITDYPEIVEKHFYNFAPINLLKRFEVDALMREEGASVRGAVVRVQQQTSHVVSLLQDRQDAEDPLQGHITQLASLVDQGQPRGVLAGLEKLEREQASKVGTRSRFRLRANIGGARLALGVERPERVCDEAGDSSPSAGNRRL